MSATAPSRKVWQSLLSSSGLHSESCVQYAAAFANERLRVSHVLDLSRSEFEDLGVTTMGDQLTIKKYIRKLLEEKSSGMDDSDSTDERHRERETHRSRRPDHRKERPSHKSQPVRSRRRHSESDDNSVDRGVDTMDVDVHSHTKMRSDVAKKPERLPAAHRLRVVRPERHHSEPAGPMRILSIANTVAHTQDTPSDDYNRGRMRSDNMPSAAGGGRSSLPPEPFNSLSRLASPPKPALQPVLVRDLKAPAKGNALKRLGPKKGGVSSVSAVSRLGKQNERFTSQTGNMLTRTISGLGPAGRSGRNNSNASRGPRSSALKRLGGRMDSVGSVSANNASHPLARC